MNTKQIKALGENPLFLELSKRRRKTRIIMVSVMMLVFLTTQIIWAFFPHIVAVRFPDDSSVSMGVWFTVLVVFTAIFLSGYYSLIAGKKLDELNQKLIGEYDHENN